MTGPAKRAIFFLRGNFDSAALVLALAHLSLFSAGDTLSDRDAQVMAALQRTNPELAGASPEVVGEYLAGFDDEQLAGLVSNVKGVLHEMDFVRVENADGDATWAALFTETNHPGTDVLLIDQATGETTELQLKATDSAGAVNEWLAVHPQGEILVTEELADRLGDAERVGPSGFSNEEISSDVQGFVDRMVDAGEGDSIWGYFPLLTSASIALVVWELWERHQRGEIDFDRFRSLALQASGIKLAKFGALLALLSIPVIGTLTGAALVAQFLWAVRGEFSAREATTAEEPKRIADAAIDGEFSRTPAGR